MSVIGALAIFSVAPLSWAWGRSGHRITALVAENYLTPETKVAIATLLQGQKIEDIASWADDIRSTQPETARWHYVDIPKDQPGFDRDRDCPVSRSDPKSPWRDCATDRILYFEGRLGDDSLPQEQRAIALKFLVHLIGDLHQPFHAIGDSRGGNDIAVSFLGSTACGPYRCNLHGVWDDAIIEHRGLSDTKYSALLLTEIKQNGWERLSGGEPTTWANLSHRDAVDAYIPNGALLTRDYVNEETRVVDAQLALSGLRVAHVLNRILGAPSSPVSAEGAKSR